MRTDLCVCHEPSQHVLCPGLQGNRYECSCLHTNYEAPAVRNACGFDAITYDALDRSLSMQFRNFLEDLGLSAAGLSREDLHALRGLGAEFRVAGSGL